MTTQHNLGSRGTVLNKPGELLKCIKQFVHDRITSISRAFRAINLLL